MTQGIYVSLINTEYTDKVVAFVKGRKAQTEEDEEIAEKE